MRPINRYNSKAEHNGKGSISNTVNNFREETQIIKLDDVISKSVVVKKVAVSKPQKVQTTTEYNSPSFLRNVVNKDTKFWTHYFTKREKARFERYLVNGEKYRPLIEKTFEDYGLPKELYYVGLIESGYNVSARSSASAVGPWQFIKATGKRYGLTIKFGVDERQSIVKSTKAAALFFQDLYNIFGSWELALSAYNAGEYGVIRRIRSANTRDFYKLSRMKKLPKETRQYVPKVLAAMNIVKNAKHYNVKVPKYSFDLFSNTKFIVLKDSVSLNNLSKKTGHSVSNIKKLNRDLTIGKTPYIRRNGYKILLPNANYAHIKQLTLEKGSGRKTASSSSNSRLSNKTHKVKSGENLSSISRKYNVKIATLKMANNLRSSKIFKGQRIKIPGKKTRTVASSSRSKSRSSEKYIVRRGDNLYKLARRNHTSISKILKLNNKTKRTIYVGEVIKLPEVSRSLYTVKSGDYLLKIAKKTGVSIAKLKKLNEMRSSKIFPGQRLIIRVN